MLSFREAGPRLKLNQSVTHKKRYRCNLHVSTGLVITGKYSKWELCIIWKNWVLGDVKLTTSSNEPELKLNLQLPRN